jgi:hypothetical protein
MATTVEIKVAPLQRANVPFPAVVLVIGAPAGAKVTATLKQVDGVPPLWVSEPQSQTAPSSGALAFPFTVTLTGPAQATLEADVKDDRATYYPPDVKAIQVVGKAGVIAKAGNK